MGGAASLAAKYLPALPQSTSQASSTPKAEPPEVTEEAKVPKKWTRTELGQLSVPQLVRWAEALHLDLSEAIALRNARQRLWEEIEKSRVPALDQVTKPSDLEHWPLTEMLRWLEYFDALDDKVAPKDKLIPMLLEHAEELPPEKALGDSAEATFLTEVERHVGMVKQAAASIIAQLGEELGKAEAREREKHPWYANGKALTDFKPSELKGAAEMKIPFIELKEGDRVDLTPIQGSGWAWVALPSNQGWAPASAVVEVAMATQDYAAEEPESMRCGLGDEFEVILRHYSGWTLCRRPKQGEDDAQEGWLPDNCLSDHPRNEATKQQHLLLSGLQRLTGDLAQVETTLFRIQTEGAAEEDSLQSLHAKVCELAEEYRKIVLVLQQNPHLLGTEESVEATENDEPAEDTIPGLPSWVRVSARCYYISKTQKKLMRVRIQRVCQVRRQILVTFEADQNARKIVEFEAFEDLATCPLQPQEKTRKKGKKHAKRAEESAQDELAQGLLEIMEVLGPEQLSAGSSEHGSESSYESDYTESTTSGDVVDPHASHSTSAQTPPEALQVEEAKREKAAKQIQAAYRRYQRTLTFAQDYSSSQRCSDFTAPRAPLSPERRESAVQLIQRVLRSYLAKEVMEMIRIERMEAERAEAEQEAATLITTLAKRYLVQVDFVMWADLCRSVQVWQAAFRRYAAQKVLEALATAERAERARRRAAATTLQSAQRCWSARRELARRKAKRDGLLLLSPNKVRSIRQIQRAMRRFAAWVELARLERYRWNQAIRIQADWRGHQCRRQVADEMQRWKQTRYEAAARLQSLAKAMGAKKQRTEATLLRSAAAQWIQTSWRRHRAQQRVAPVLRRRQLAAARLQGIHRMAKARRELKRLQEEREQKEQLSAIKIQSHVRSRHAQKEVGPLLQARRERAQFLQRFMRKIWALRQVQALRKERASIKVQSTWRRQLAMAEATKRRAREVDQLLSSLLEGRPEAMGTCGGQSWLAKVTAALEWKTKREIELEEKELRQRRQAAFISLPMQGLEELTRPESLLASALIDRSMAALMVAKRRARCRMKALLQTQANKGEGRHFSYDPELCKSLSLDHGVLIRLNPEDSIAEVANLLQTAWSVAFQRKTAEPVEGTPSALQVLLGGVRSLQRKLQIDLVAAGRATSAEESAAHQDLLDMAERAGHEAVSRATEARQAVVLPLKEELEQALLESQAALKELNSCIARVKPEVETIKSKYKEDAEEAEAKLREEREQKHAQTVALNKIAIRTQIEKERLEAGLMDKNKPKITCYKKVFANVKDLQQELKDLEVSGTANRKSQGILQHTLRALESRAAKAESDSKSKVIFGEAEEDLIDFKPSDKVLQKQERGEEQEKHFRRDLESEVQSLHADMESQATKEAGTLGAQLRAEAEVAGEAAAEGLECLNAWRARADLVRQWLAEVVPIARSSAQIQAASDFIKVCKSAEASHSLAAGLKAVQKHLKTQETQAEKAAGEAGSPREGQLPQVLQKLQNALKALSEVKTAFPDLPRSPMRTPDHGRKLYGREEEPEEPEQPRSRIPSVNSPPPFPPPDEALVTEDTQASPALANATALRKPGVPSASAARPAGGTKNLSIAGLAQLGQGLSALSALQPPSLAIPRSNASSPQRPSSANSPGKGDTAERSDKVGAPLRSAPNRPSSAAASRAREAPKPAGGSSGSAMKAVQKARAVAGWE